MQLKRICAFVILIMTITSLIYSFYLEATHSLSLLLKLRLFNFVSQHICLICILAKWRFCSQYQQSFPHLKYMIIVPSIFFSFFGAIQLWGIKSGHNQIDMENLVFNVENIVMISYFHIYFQINMYIGIFSMFAIAMGILQNIIKCREREAEEPYPQLKSQKYEVNDQEEEICSICLNNFQAYDKVYQLICKHKFHKICLKDWLAQKKTCPLCRNSLNSNNENNHSVEYFPFQYNIDSYQHHQQINYNYYPQYINQGSVPNRNQYHGIN